MSDEVVLDEKKDVWTSSLAQEYQNLPTFTKFKDVNDLAKSYVNLEKLIGVDKVPMPKDDKDESGWANLFSRLGRPESPDKYDVKLDLPEGLSVPEDSIKGFKDAAFKAGLSQKQINHIMGYWVDQEKNAYLQRLESEKTAIAESETALRRKFGPNFESSKKNVEAFVKLHYPQGKVDSIMGRLLRDPEEFEAVFNASKSFSEDTLKVGKPVGPSIEEAESQARGMLADAKGPLRNNLHPEHDAAVKKYNDLQVLIHQYKNQQ